jgi:hypothetical protein
VDTEKKFGYANPVVITQSFKESLVNLKKQRNFVFGGRRFINYANRKLFCIKRL